MHEPPYYTNYSKSRLFVHNVVTSKYFDLAIAAVIDRPERCYDGDGVLHDAEGIDLRSENI